MTKLFRWILLSGCVVGAPVIAGIVPQSAAAAGDVTSVADPANACPTATGLPQLTNADDPNQVQAFGWQVFQSLVETTSGQAKNTPDWEVWDTKCTVLGQKSACSGEAAPGASGRQQPLAQNTAAGAHVAKRAQQRLLKSMEVPVRGGKVANLGRPPIDSQLQSVHYNPIASASIAAQQGAPAGQGKMPSLCAGAILVKALWEPVATAGHAVFVSTLTPDWERKFQGGLVQQLPMPRNVPGGQQEWATLDPDNCVVDRSPQHPLMRECIHQYSLAGGPPNPGVLTNCNFNCTVALVGLQMMVRAQPDKPWIWISVWWNGAENTLPSKAMLPAPWRYYTLGATNKDRSATLNGTRNILFNPYLEGVVIPNGRVSNCLTCHQYAGVGPTGASLTSDSTALEELFAPAFVTVPSRDVAPEKPRKDYFAAATLTDSSWSLADSAPAKPQTAGGAAKPPK